METLIKKPTHIIKIRIVGNPLLSERDGNITYSKRTKSTITASRKPTTL